jgi:hypothetical protein
MSTHTLDRFFQALTDLPVIFQSVLGSALFAAMVLAGQRFYAYVACRIAGLSKERRKTYLIEQQIIYNVLAARSNPDKAAFLLLLMYRASRSLFMALIWLTLGLIFASVEPSFGMVGYLGCIYFLFSGLITVAGPKIVEDPEAKLEEIRLELEKLDQA